MEKCVFAFIKVQKDTSGAGMVLKCCRSQRLFLALFYLSCKDVSDCPETMVYSYSVKFCNYSCRSLSELDRLCSVKSIPMEGCGCPEGTYLNADEHCVLPENCPCYYKGQIIEVEKSFQEDEMMWYVDSDEVMFAS